jgi:type IV pilus assembly protein PilB
MMIFDDAILKKILLDGSYVTADVLEKAEAHARDMRVSLVEYLIAKERITKNLLGQAIAEHLQISFSDLKAHQPTQEQIQKIPEVIAKKLRVVLFSDDKKKVVIATDNPAEARIRRALDSIFPGRTLVITYALPEDIDTSFIHYQTSLATRFEEIIKGQHHVAPELFNAIISDALSFRASDIHFEPQLKEVIVRFRVDGALREAGKIPKEYYDNLLNRIKIQGRMRIDEHFAAQDGSLRFEHEGKMVDLRASIIPTIEGEKIVLRLLTAYIQGFSLANLGLLQHEQDTLAKAAEKPFGMILVAGPTGSGKTTTLYAVLKVLHEPDVNITTIEDPVEYKVAGVNQIQVNALTGLTFAKGLRSVVRQDPDIILVGEIRDKETAEIAVNAALTGHLLLSTFHANDAATAIPRLLDMGVEPFLLASTLNVVIAQRLVRKICDHCKHSITVSPKEMRLKRADRFFGKGKVTLYEGKKCVACNHTGYKGRLAIVEIIEATPELQALVLTNPSTQQVWALAKKQGSRTMFEDGIEKVKSGLITLEELLRVAQPPAG